MSAQPGPAKATQRLQTLDSATTGCCTRQTNGFTKLLPLAAQLRRSNCRHSESQHKLNRSASPTTKPNYAIQHVHRWPWLRSRHLRPSLPCHAHSRFTFRVLRTPSCEALCHDRGGFGQGRLASESATLGLGSCREPQSAERSKNESDVLNKNGTCDCIPDTALVEDRVMPAVV